MKRAALFVSLLICAGTPARPGPARAQTPAYGCWSIHDTIERLACFDLALGPPAQMGSGMPATGSSRPSGEPGSALASPPQAETGPD